MTSYRTGTNVTSRKLETIQEVGGHRCRPRRYAPRRRPEPKSVACGAIGCPREFGLPVSMRQDALVASEQTAGEIAATIERLYGKRITLLQVLGINSLKSLSPPVGALVGDTVEGSEVVDRILTLRTSSHVIAFDLQRTGRVVWVRSTEPFRLGTGPMPTVRLVTDDGSVDLTEPAKTKRITVVVTEQGESGP